MRVIKHVLSEFIGLFVCMYLLNLADGGISTVVGYNIIVVSITYLFLAGSGSIAKTSRRTILMHAGIILHVIYFAVVALMGPAVTKFFYIPAILMGMSEGLYWSCFNLLLAEGVENKNRRKFMGTYTVFKGIIGILFPIFIGNTIYKMGFHAGLAFVGVLSVINMILGMSYVDTKQENSQRYRPALMFKAIRDDLQLRRMFVYHFFTGMTYSAGAFSVAVNIFMIGVTGDSMKAGWMAGALSLVTCVSGFMFGKFFRTAKRQKGASASVSVCLSVCTCLMVSCPNPVTVSIFYFAYGLYKDISSNIDACICDDHANSSSFIKEHKSEYYTLGDTALVVGRVSGFVILYLYSCTMSSAFLYIFLIPVFACGCIFHKCLSQKS